MGAPALRPAGPRPPGVNGSHKGPSSRPVRHIPIDALNDRRRSDRPVIKSPHYRTLPDGRAVAGRRGLAQCFGGARHTADGPRIHDYPPLIILAEHHAAAVAAPPLPISTVTLRGREID